LLPQACLLAVFLDLSLAVPIALSDLNIHTLENKSGVKMKVTNLGGTVMELWVPDRDGKLDDIVLGYDQPEEYITGNSHFGALIGRYANRIANGKFRLNGSEFQLARNNGPNSIHGGPGGFHNVLWKIEHANDHTLALAYHSVDGEEGFPGNLDIKVTYTLTDENDFVIDYVAVTDRTTVVNMTQHSFFNLAGDGAGQIQDHELMINAEYITELDSRQIPTGRMLAVEGTPFDFRHFRLIKDNIDAQDIQLKLAKGFDHNWVLKKVDDFSMAAVVREPNSGRTMEVWTSQPGLQFYSSNYLHDKMRGKSGKPYPYRSALCLEAQHFPDSPNHPNFPSTALKPGEMYKHRTVYKFRTY